MKIAPSILVAMIVFVFSAVILYAGHLEIFGQSDYTSNSTSISISKIFKDVQGSVVQITRENKQAPDSPGDENVTSLGSGFVFDKEGRIITNHHVVQDSKSVDVTFIDGNRYVASVIGSDPFNDVAVIKITQNISEKLRPLILGNSSVVEVGDQVIAIGNPYGLAGSMSLGIVSQKGRLISTEGSAFSIPSVIQTDALINPGNSGGPLLNTHEEVIGMNTAGVLSDSGAFSGIGLAVPSNTISKIVPVLNSKGNYTHPWLGVSASSLTSKLTENFENLSRDFKGVYVDSITKNGPADKAGLRGSTTDQYGDKHGTDIITAVDNRNVTYMEDLVSYLDENKKPGEKLNLTVLRNQSYLDIGVLLGDRSNSTKTNDTKDPYD
ncbi:MAG: trypsin-like peptidase domain-containing protein [Nitrososphaeraceae archaeon]|jgi:S1-C subfamily serine protease|nr:trypsin-like peptidase domain-containing protein [Nitrososphaeraceae archaeon]MDW0169074.1 trypsin-like peptidase domain-containing protein [Nitrososphaeraceae archaeon]MDW0172009.1 trypsin-like peptidase domain-containing protein [Nitrososphaeraceae archaeon]MDW0173884.1 trypsin-like peptidase domain-containing protein [Nitrososphaeraceae archaeon]MDW0175291.1 trypsin-like peptidase domain-containing protein [Nitrososphaeraceae archaeon]